MERGNRKEQIGADATENMSQVGGSQLKEPELGEHKWCGHQVARKTQALLSVLRAC